MQGLFSWIFGRSTSTSTPVVSENPEIFTVIDEPTHILSLSRTLDTLNTDEVQENKETEEVKDIDENMETEEVEINKGVEENKETKEIENKEEIENNKEIEEKNKKVVEVLSRVVESYSPKVPTYSKSTRKRRPHNRRRTLRPKNWKKNRNSTYVYNRE